MLVAAMGLYWQPAAMRAAQPAVARSGATLTGPRHPGRWETDTDLMTLLTFAAQMLLAVGLPLALGVLATKEVN